MYKTPRITIIAITNYKHLSAATILKPHLSHLGYV